jgi:hypothetical protein
MKKESGSNRGTIKGAVIVLTVIALLFLWKPADRTVPETLIGAWSTTNAKYADRKMEIGPTTISFTTGEGTVATGIIKQIGKREVGARALYTVEYDIDGTRNEVSFYVEILKAKNVIWFKNQQSVIWTKDDNS